MRFDRIDEIKQNSFRGFVAISALQASNCHEVPEEPGVYLVLRLHTSWPVFRRKSTGGRFKGKDPTVAVNQLKDSWVEESVVLYIGKAGGPGKKATLRSRLRQYMRFGQGNPAPHRGGRYIWQLGDSGSLVICWRPTFNAHPRTEEKRLIQEFKDTYEKRPFANLTD